MKTREMRGLTVLGMAALVAAAVSCKKSGDDAEPLPAQGVFRAVAEAQAGDSKTEINSSRDVLWTAGDAIRVYNGSHTPGDFTLINGAGSSRGDFAEPQGLLEGFYDNNYTALYPAAKAGYDGTNKYYTLDLPESQDYAANTFGQNANPMAAQSGTTSLSFQNLCGTLMLELGNNAKQELKVQRIRVITRKSGESLSGPAKVTFGSSGAGVQMLQGETSRNYVDLDCRAGGGVDISTDDKTFYIVLPGGTLTAGFDVEVELKKGTETSLCYYRKGVGSVMDNSIHTAQVRVMPKLDITVGFFNLDGKALQFASGNLYWKATEGWTPNPEIEGDVDEGTWGIEEHPWGCGVDYSSPVWDANYVSHFRFTNNSSEAVLETGPTSTTFFTQSSASGFPALDSDGKTKQWYTLSMNEWSYVINRRNVSYRRWAKVYMRPNETGKADVRGLLLLPAEWGVPVQGGLQTWPEGYKPLSETAFNNTGWDETNVVNEDWLKAGQMYGGCVFLPCAGYRNGSAFVSVRSDGYYWSCTPTGTASAYAMRFSSDGTVFMYDSNYRSYGLTVRPVLKN